MAKHAGPNKAGKNKRRCDRYKTQDRRFKNKLRRVLKHNGPQAADAYRMAHITGKPYKEEKK